MSVHDKIFKNMKLDVLTEQLLSGASKNWRGTPFEKYPILSSKAKGKFGEYYVEGFMRSQLKCKIVAPSSTDHDRIIDGYKTEIKFGLAMSPKSSDYKIEINSFVFNHIACGKEWDRLIFCGINPSKNNAMIYAPDSQKWQEVNMYFMDKSLFLKYMKSGQTGIFANQQGGKKGNNDDYMVGGPAKFKKLVNLPFVRPISQWRDK